MLVSLQPVQGHREFLGERTRYHDALPQQLRGPTVVPRPAAALKRPRGHRAVPFPPSRVWASISAAHCDTDESPAAAPASGSSTSQAASSTRRAWSTARRESPRTSTTAAFRTDCANATARGTSPARSPAPTETRTTPPSRTDGPSNCDPSHAARYRPGRRPTNTRTTGRPSGCTSPPVTSPPALPQPPDAPRYGPRPATPPQAPTAPRTAGNTTPALQAPTMLPRPASHRAAPPAESPSPRSAPYTTPPHPEDPAAKSPHPASHTTLVRNERPQMPRNNLRHPRRLLRRQLQITENPLDHLSNQNPLTLRQLDPPLLNARTNRRLTNLHEMAAFLLVQPQPHAGGCFLGDPPVFPAVLLLRDAPDERMLAVRGGHELDLPNPIPQPRHMPGRPLHLVEQGLSRRRIDRHPIRRHRRPCTGLDRPRHRHRRLLRRTPTAQLAMPCPDVIRPPPGDLLASPLTLPLPRTTPPKVMTVRALPDGHDASPLSGP